MKSKNPFQLTVACPAGRNDSCPCGSGKKFKKCHQNPSALEAQDTLNWLKVNDTTPPDGIDYNSVTVEELLEPGAARALYIRKREVEDARQPINADSKTAALTLGLLA